MDTDEFRPSLGLEAFLMAEIANEIDGGVSPTTLGSALGSLRQMPEDVFRTLNRGVAESGISADDAEVELDTLAARLGEGFEVEPALPREAWARRAGWPPGLPQAAGAEKP